MHSCCIHLLVLDFLERCEQPICSATPQLKWFSEQKHINSIGWNQQQKTQQKHYTILYSTTDSHMCFCPNKGFAFMFFLYFTHYPQTIICFTPTRLKLHHLLFVALKRKRGHRTLSFLADLLMAHIPTKSCASSGHDRIHPVTFSPSDHPVNPRTADSNGNPAPSSQLRCWSLRCKVAVHPGKEKTKHGQLVKRQKGFIERILQLSFPTKMLGTAWNSSAVRAWYTTPINSPILLGITNTKPPHNPGWP